MTATRKKWSRHPGVRAQFHQRVVQAVQSLGFIPVIPLMAHEGLLAFYSKQLLAALHMT